MVTISEKKNIEEKIFLNHLNLADIVKIKKIIIKLNIFNILAPERIDPQHLSAYDKYDSKIHKNNVENDLDGQKRKLENIYKHNDNDYKNVIFIKNFKKII